MHIVFLIKLNKKFGGGSYTKYKLAEALAERGHKVTAFYVSNSKLVQLSWYRGKGCDERPCLYRNGYVQTVKEKIDLKIIEIRLTKYSYLGV